MLSYADLLKQQGKGEQAAALLHFVGNHKISMFATRKAAGEKFAALPEDLQRMGLEQSKSLGLEDIVAEILGS